MITKFKNTDFILESGTYYSPAFKIEESDVIMSVEVTLSTTGSVSIQASSEGSTWYDIANTGFSCTPSGLQTYIECQSQLLYRLKSTTAFTSAKIIL